MAIGLANGHSVEEVAGAPGVRVWTARTHLEQVLARTGTRRQAELVRPLLSSPVVASGTEPG